MAKGTKQSWSAIGRVGGDPEVAEKKTVLVAKLRIATTDIFKNKDGGKYEERTDWHNITLFGQLAEYCRDYVKKGDTVAVDAKLRNHKWEDKDGVEHFRNDLTAYSVMKVGKIIKHDKASNDSKKDKDDSENNAVSTATIVVAGDPTLADIV